MVRIDSPRGASRGGLAWIVGVGFSLLSAGGLTPAASAGVAASPNTPPTYLGDFAGPGLADMYPVDVADTSTHYYVMDPGRYSVFAVNRLTGQIDYSKGGHQGKANGQFSAARAIAVDSLGRVYVADTANNRVQRFSSTLVYQRKWGSGGTGPGQFKMVYGIAVGMGKGAGGAPAQVVYTTDAGRIQKFDLDGNYLAQFGVGALNQPRQLAVHPVTRDIYVVSARDREIVVFDQDGVEQFRFGSEGTGPGQFMGDPRGIDIADDGTVYVSDDGNRRIQVFDSTGIYVGEFANTGTAAEKVTDPRGLTTTSDGKVLVTDEWTFSLKEYLSNGTFVRKLFGTPAPVGGFNTPRGMAVSLSTGRVFGVDWWNQRIQRFDADGTDVLAWGFRGTKKEPGSINFAWDVAVQSSTGRVFVANRESNEIEVFEPNGVYVNRWSNATVPGGKLKFPQGLAFDPTDGTLLVSDSGNNRIQRFSITANGHGTWVATYGSFGTGIGSFNTPTGIDVAPDGTIWVADTQNSRVQKRSPGGTWTAYAMPAGGTVFRSPWGVTVAPDGSIWVADSGNDRIVKMTAGGNLNFVATGTDLGAGPLDAPFAIEFKLSGTILVSDAWNNRIIELGY